MFAQVHIDIQIASESQKIPKSSDFQLWTSSAIGTHRNEAEVSLRIVDVEESTKLNQKWCQKNGPTNVLAFPANLSKELNLHLLGDLFICAPVIEQEAREKNKPLHAHWVHMIVHGTLHLLGYDHIQDDEAEEMAALETVTIQQLSFPDPYTT